MRKVREVGARGVKDDLQELREEWAVREGCGGLGGIQLPVQ